MGDPKQSSGKGQMNSVQLLIFNDQERFNWAGFYKKPLGVSFDSKFIQEKNTLLIISDIGNMVLVFGNDIICSNVISAIEKFKGNIIHDKSSRILQLEKNLLTSLDVRAIADQHDKSAKPCQASNAEMARKIQELEQKIQLLQQKRQTKVYDGSAELKKLQEECQNYETRIAELKESNILMQQKLDAEQQKFKEHEAEFNKLREFVAEMKKGNCSDGDTQSLDSPSNDAFPPHPALICSEIFSEECQRYETRIAELEESNILMQKKLDAEQQKFKEHEAELKELREFVAEMKKGNCSDVEIQSLDSPSNDAFPPHPALICSEMFSVHRSTGSGNICHGQKKMNWENLKLHLTEKYLSFFEPGDVNGQQPVLIIAIKKLHLVRKVSEADLLSVNKNQLPLILQILYEYSFNECINSTSHGSAIESDSGDLHGKSSTSDAAMNNTSENERIEVPPNTFESPSELFIMAEREDHAKFW
uniref:Uncharacterized protein n=1 Tax=Panagrolaimus sp. ES5 TaxID=591445 RepID=A0AC34FJP8_9BILA